MGFQRVGHDFATKQNNNQDVLSGCYMSDSILSALISFSHHNNIVSKYFYHHLTDRNLQLREVK